MRSMRQMGSIRSGRKIFEKYDKQQKDNRRKYLENDIFLQCLLLICKIVEWIYICQIYVSVVM